jgi:hypothetical protein
MKKALVNMKTDTCSVCSKKLDSKFGHNAEPVNNGRCCSQCNDTVVIPYRMALIFMDAKKHF